VTPPSPHPPHQPPRLPARTVWISPLPSPPCSPSSVPARICMGQHFSPLSLSVPHCSGQCHPILGCAALLIYSLTRMSHGADFLCSKENSRGHLRAAVLGACSGPSGREQLLLSQLSRPQRPRLPQAGLSLSKGDRPG
jgi:hypothetical protein